MNSTMEMQAKTFLLPEVSADAQTPNVAALRAEAEARFQADVFMLSGQTPEQWEARSRAEFGPSEKRRLAELLAKSRDAGLNAEEQAEMQDFIGENEAMAVERAAALFLLESNRKARE